VQAGIRRYDADMTWHTQTFQVETLERDQMVEITARVRQAVRDAGVNDGGVVVYVPHTTAGVTINENADPDVVHDMLAQLDQMVPWSQPFYRHGEGNSASHVKASMMGSSVTVLVRDGRLVLGTWQGVWFCEFDGPRTRSVHVAVSGE
jgi:secondary thiamine-phosphate synthase enzyme